MIDLSITIYIQEFSLPGILWLSISMLFYNLFSSTFNPFCLDLTQLPKTWFYFPAGFPPTTCFSAPHSSHVVIYLYQDFRLFYPHIFLKRRYCIIYIHCIYRLTLLDFFCSQLCGSLFPNLRGATFSLLIKFGNNFSLIGINELSDWNYIS